MVGEGFDRRLRAVRVERDVGDEVWSQGVIGWGINWGDNGWLRLWGGAVLGERRKIGRSSCAGVGWLRAEWQR